VFGMAIQGCLALGRQPFEIWRKTRLRVLKRGGYVCARPGCGVALTEETAHIDHIVSGKFGSNHVSNLRALCRRCHPTT